MPLPITHERGYIMTKSIVKKIFIDDATKRETTIKKACDAILEECNRLQTIIGELGNDDAALAVIADGQFAFLYDKTSGKKNKPSMSASMRQLKGAMLHLATNADDFTAWCNNGEKTQVTSLRGIKDAIKPKKEKAEKIADDASDETETENSDEPSQKTNRSESELLKNFLDIWHAETGGNASTLIDFMESTMGADLTFEFDETHKVKKVA